MVKARAKTKKGHSWVLIVVVILVLAVGGSMWLFKSRLWDGKSRFTVVEFGEEIVVASFDPQTQRGLRLVLPNNLQIDTLQGRGLLSASSLTAAGDGDWAARSIAHALGIFSLGSSQKLSWLDKASWWWWQGKIDWRKIDLEEVGWVERRSTVDKVEQAQLKPGWDQQAGEWFSSLIVAQEGLSIKIENSTSVDGLASKAARSIESAGIKVSQLEEGAKLQDKCVVTTPLETKKSIGIRLIKQNFGCDWREGEEMVLILGEEYQRQLEGN